MVDAIRILAARYTAAANRRDYEAAASVYCHDAVLAAFGSAISGKEAIRATYAALFPTLDFIHQQCVAETIEVEGDQAHAAWSVTEYNRRIGEEKMSLFLGRYNDEMRRMPDGNWLFTRRTLTCVARMRIDGTMRLG